MKSKRSGVFAEDAKHLGHAFLALVAIGAVANFAFQRARHHFKEGAIQRFAHGRQLLRDVLARFVLLDHPQHTPNLALGAPQAQHDAAFVFIAAVLRIVGHGAARRSASFQLGIGRGAGHGGFLDVDGPILPQRVSRIPVCPIFEPRHVR
ncbi:MAG: hypothetical protein R3F18_09325 [Lysobacterales bacterium]